MTTARMQSSPSAETTASAAWPALGPVRLAWLHTVSRRVPTALGLLVALGALLWSALHWRWNIAGGPAARGVIPLTIEAGAAALIAVSTYGPFGEPERATGRWLPYLRLSAAILLTTAAFGALAAGSTGGLLPSGTLALLRNMAGMSGLGLLSATAFGGAFGWTGPMAYLVITETALTGHPTTPWVWAARPPHDFGAALCASAVFAAGIVAITVLGARDSDRGS
jgi:hypothetical protein